MLRKLAETVGIDVGDGDVPDAKPEDVPVSDLTIHGKPQGGAYTTYEISADYVIGRSESEYQCRQHMRAEFDALTTARHRDGYRLHSWCYHRVATTPGTMNELIMAVYERRQL